MGEDSIEQSVDRIGLFCSYPSFFADAYKIVIVKEAYKRDYFIA